MKALVLNDYGGDADYATLVYQGIKTIETRMGRLFSHRGDIVICKGATKSVGENKGMALCVVNIYDGRMMQKSDEKSACIDWHPDRRSLLLKDWRYFSRMFKFSDQAVKNNFQGVFEITIPDDVALIPQPQIKGFEDPYLLFNVPATGTRQSKRKPASLDRIKVNHELAKSRYYYHRRLDRSLFKIDGATRIIECDFACLEDIPEGNRPYGEHKAGQRHYIRELVNLGYNVQFKLTPL